MSRSDVEQAAALMNAMNGRAVLLCKVDFAFSLVIDGGSELRIERAFDFIDEDPPRRCRVDVEADPASCAPALALCQRRSVRRCIVNRDASLRVEFDGSTAIDVGAGEKFEAWQWTGPNRDMVIAVPGGALAIWSANS